MLEPRPPSPVAPLATTARTSSASVSVMTVAPTVVATAGIRRSARSAGMIGYTTSVCDAQSEPMRIDAGRSKPRSSAPMVPNAIGQRERQQPERDRRLPEPGEHVEVELEAGQEHEVQQADLAQRVDRS